MTALYLLANEYKAAAAALADLDLDEVTVANTLEGLAGDLEAKATNVALMCRSLDATAASVKAWAKDANDRAKAIEARAEALRAYLARCLTDAAIERVEGPGVVISWRKSSAVVIDEPELIPQEFMRTPEPPPPAPDKAAIAERLRAGVDIPGAHLEHRRNLQIK
jgi:hypothetical protein